MDPRFEARIRALGLDPAQFRESFLRSGGKGGQHANKVESCVIVRHVPTGITVRCAEERTQSRNRRLAWERLLERIARRRLSEEEARRQALEKERRRKRPRPHALKEKILLLKRRRSEIKRSRRPPAVDF